MNENRTMSLRMQRHRSREQRMLRYATICAAGGNDGQALNFFDVVCRERRAYEEAKARFQRHQARERERYDRALNLFRI